MPAEQAANWSGLLRAAGALLAVAAAAFVAREVVHQWPRLGRVVADTDRGWLLVALGLFAVAEVVYASAWPVTLRALGHPVDPRDGTATFLVTQTAKFIPGSVWAAVGRVGGGNRLRVPARVTGASLLIETGVSLCVALLIAGLTGTVTRALHGSEVPTTWTALAEAGLAFGCGLGALGVGITLARRFAPLPSARNLSTVGAWHLTAWLGYGLATAALARSVGVPAVPALGAFTLAWAIGFVVVGAPAGLGVREVVMTAALAAVATPAGAVAVVVGSRALWTIVQLVGAAAAVVVLSRRRVRAARSAAW